MIDKMKLNFVGEPRELQAGIRELCADLNVSLCEDGMKIAVIQKDGADLSVCVKNGEGVITYDRKIHFFRAFRMPRFPTETAAFFCFPPFRPQRKSV